MFPQLLRMSQAQLDELFTASAGRPIPEGQANARRSSRRAPCSARRSLVINQPLRLAGQGLRSEVRNAEEPHRPVGLNAILAKVYKAPSWLDGKGVRRPRLFRHLVSSRNGSATKIRLVQSPGLYLGKVYWDKARLIDFALQF